MNMYRNSVIQTPSYENNDVIVEPFSYLQQVPGKEIRSLLITAFNNWLRVPEDKIAEISKIVSMLHTASLLIDDIEDNSKLRRGIPVAHSVYGIPWTINCGNYVYFLAMEKCTQLGSSEAVKHFLEEMIRLHHGQGFDIYWRDSNTCPTEEEYLKMVEDKTSGLFRLAIKLMSSFSSNTEDFIPLATKLGVYFQVRDDYINLKSSDYVAKKGYCEDLSEGKFSFPLIHGITTNPFDRRLLNILKQKTEDVDIKKYAVDYLEACGSFTYTVKRLEELLREIKEDLAKFPYNPDLEGIISMLADLGHEKTVKPPIPHLRLSSDDIILQQSGEIPK